MDVMQQVITIIGSSGLCIAALTFLAKSLMTHLLSKDLDEHKLKLDFQSQTELERLRSELTIQLVEHEVRFKRLDEKMADHLSQIYGRLQIFFKSVADCVVFVSEGEEPHISREYKIPLTASKEFWDYFLFNQVYVHPKLSQNIKSFANELDKILNQFIAGAKAEKEEHYTVTGNLWLQAINDLDLKAEPLFNELISEIQIKLGIENA